MYGQGLAIQALAEAVRSVSPGPFFTEVEVKNLRGYLQSAVTFLMDAENPGSGWRYQARGGDNDTAVTATALLALEAAQRAGVKMTPNAYAGGLEWFDSATEKSTQRVGYNAKGTGKVFIPGLNESYDDHPTMTAAAWLCRIVVGGDKPPSARLAAQLVFGDSPKFRTNGRDYYYWYYGTRFAKVAFEPKEWETWKIAMLAVLARGQYVQLGECRRGSWDADDRWGCEGGRVYATAINLLTLEHLLLAKPFEFLKGPKAPATEAGESEFKWIFHLWNGGKIKVVSYGENDDKYVLRVGSGTMTIPKDVVEKITKYDAKEK
jgi:hypothetical protein